MAKKTVKKVAPKKVAPKKTVKEVKVELPEIKAKQVGKTLNLVVGKELYKKPNIEKEEVDKIKVKIDLYNKKPTKERMEEIIKLVSAVVVEEEKKEAEKKGTKVAVKKAAKRVAKASKGKEEVEEPSLVEQVKVEFKEGNLTQTEIDELRALLNKKEKEIKETPKEETRTNTGRGYERNR